MEVVGVGDFLRLLEDDDRKALALKQIITISLISGDTKLLSNSTGPKSPALLRVKIKHHVHVSLIN